MIKKRYLWGQDKKYLDKDWVWDTSVYISIFSHNRSYFFESDDIRNPVFPPVTWDDTREICKKIPQSDGGKKCYNQIQVVKQLNETHVAICGSNSMLPQNRLLHRQVCIC